MSAEIGTRHYERFTMECEAFVAHRDDCFVQAQGDPAGLPWRGKLWSTAPLYDSPLSAINGRH